MAEITIQDVAQYLAEHGYATWSELTTRKMLTEDGMWTRLQSNYDPSRAIDPRYIIFPTVDLSEYAKDADIKQWVQDQGYATTVPSLSGYATQQWVQQQCYLTQHQSLSGYATQSWVTARIQSSVSGFASQAWVGQTFLQLSGGTMTGDIESQNIIPVTDNEYTLGTSTKRWSIIRTMKADFAGEIYTHGKIYAYGNIQPMPNSNNAYPQLGTSAARWANVLTSGVNCAGNIIPATTETYQLGTRQYRWNNVVTKSIDASGTSSLAALIVSGSATFNNGINVATGSLTIATGSLTIGGCTISWDPDVSMLHISTGIYSDGAVTAGGVGSSGGGGGGGLTWANLAAATTEQIALSHLTVALSGYLTSYGNRPSIGMAGSSVSWIPENYGVILPLTNAGAGNYQLDLSGYAKTSDLHSHSNKSVLDGITSNKVNNWDTAYGWGNHASAGYVTGYGYRPSVALTDGTPLGSNYTIYLPLTSQGGGGFKLDLSSYAKTTGNNTFTGSNTFKTSIELRDNAGIDFYDGIDTWNFFIDFSHDSRGSFCWCTAGQDIAWLDCDGNFYASAYRNSSDLRRKNLFGDVALSVADIAAMPAVRFRWNSGRDTQTMHVGTIAQAWQTLLPEVVLEGSDGLLSMDYASAALVSVINVAKSVNDHERRILDLEAENRRLKTELEQLKSA